MNPEKYLQDLLKSQNLTSKEETDLISHKKEITTFLQKEFGTEPTIRYAGSYAKETMIRESYDLDIVCYFPCDEDRSLKDIRQAVAEHLSTEYLLKPKASAERILDLKGSKAPIDFHIDIVPGRFIDNTSNDVFLHVVDEEKERMKTNLKTHIDFIKSSGCVPIIRLTKLWAHRHGINIRTFVLELFVIKALEGSRSKDNYKESFLQVLEAFRDDFGTTRLVDPANGDNVVSKLVSGSDKILISDLAKKSLDLIEKSDDTSNWSKVFKEGEKTSGSTATVLPYVPGQPFTPTRPWCK